MSTESDPYFKPFDPNPSSAANNKHHEGYYRSAEEYLSETVHLPGRPEDVGCYPGQHDLNYQQINRVDRGKEYDDTNG